jgi:hypothetical protein
MPGGGSILLRLDPTESELFLRRFPIQNPLIRILYTEESEKTWPWLAAFDTLVTNFGNLAITLEPSRRFDPARVSLLP